MKRVRHGYALALLVAAAGCLAPATADAAFVVLDPGTGGPALNSWTLGYQFTVGGQRLKATQLGLWDYLGNGFDVPDPYRHQVGLWDASGLLLASVTMPFGTAAPLLDEFRYQPLITSVFLEPGVTYVLGATYKSSAAPAINDDRYRNHSGTPLTTDLVHSFRTRQSGSTTNLVYPATSNYANELIIGPNLVFFVVPEPSAMLLLGLAGLVAIRRRR